MRNDIMIQKENVIGNLQAKVGTVFAEVKFFTRNFSVAQLNVRTANIAWYQMSINMLCSLFSLNREYYLVCNVVSSIILL